MSDIAKTFEEWLAEITIPGHPTLGVLSREDAMRAAWNAAIASREEEVRARRCGKCGGRGTVAA